MSLVDKNHRGSFTANKEIMSLVFGMVFSFAMGALVDRFKNAGEIRVAFILSAAVIFVLMTVHSLTMIFSVEKPSERPVALKFGQALNDLAKNKKVLHITMVFVLYYISTYISVPFYGAYQIGELGLNLKFISAIAICGSISRILISKFWGNYADKKSFARMLEKCFIVLAFSQLCIIFAVPSTGKVTFVLYYILHGIALGGINSALTNMIFEHIPGEKAADALAVTQAFAGLAGFLATLAVSPLVSCIQKSGNRIFGIPVYAQQLVTVLALLFTVFAIIYTRCVFIQKESK
jgi:Na+/melibiose symporter-like transporter